MTSPLPAGESQRRWLEAIVGMPLPPIGYAIEVSAHEPGRELYRLHWPPQPGDHVGGEPWPESDPMPTEDDPDD